MIVTEIEKITKTKSKIYIDHELAFILTRAELNRYGLFTGGEVSETVYEEMMAGEKLKARKKAMALLTDSDRTEQELRTRLVRAGFSPALVDDAIEYVRSYNYLDDERYAKLYVQFKSGSKSRDMIRYELIGKGVAPSDIDAAFEEYEYDEKDMIRQHIRHRYPDLAEQPPKIRQNAMNYLLRKGYRFEDIRQVMKEFDNNDIF